MKNPYKSKTKSDKKQIFKAIKENILSGEIDIHLDMVENSPKNGYHQDEIDIHLEAIKKIKKTKTLHDLLIIMNDDFGMDLDRIYQIYM